MNKTELAKRKGMTRKKVHPHQNGYSFRNRVKLVHSGNEFFTLLKELIDTASHTIHLQTYILDHDTTGTFIADALVNAAKRNVSICVVADGFASQKLSHAYIQRLKEAGINFRFFEPLLRSRHFYFGRRLHHKVVVIDGVKALVGSMNIADRYHDLPGKKAWFDLALYAEGEVALDLHRVCNRLWSFRKAKGLRVPEDVHDFIAAIPEEETCAVRVRQNDWVKGKNQASATYFELFSKATKSITIVSSYFLPGKNLRNQLEKAVKRNVEVKVALAGSSDLKIVKLAEKYLYRWMSRNNMIVYEYQPTVLHTKMAIADSNFLTLGSYNVNDLSAHASVELNLDVKDESFVKKIQKETDAMIERDCQLVDLSIYTTRLFTWQQLIRWLSFQLIRVSVTVGTFYFRQRE